MMRKITSIFLLSIFSYFICSAATYARDRCKKDQSIPLNIFSKNDYRFESFSCDAEQGTFLKNYLINTKKRIFLNEFYEFSAKEEPKVVAVSIYKSKRNNPLLISISTAFFCCTPQIEGYSYEVKIYEIKKQNDGMILKDITQKLLKDDDSGFEGKTDERIYYKYKNIASIKKWLDKNYK